MDETVDAKKRPDAALIAALEEADYHPIWDRFMAVTPIEPNATDTAHHWPWAKTEPFTERAAKEVPMEDAERRAIIPVNPDFQGATLTTTNMISAFTVLEPGDRALPHRHTFSAIRFATRSEGATTIVNGRRCEMHEGDVVLTPSMSWHGHINEGDRRTTWFDAADLPFINSQDLNFLEFGDERSSEDFWKVDEGAEGAWSGAGLKASNVRHDDPNSPKYRYPGEVTRATLDRMASGAEGAKVLRYTNPVTGGPVMTTLDLYMMRLTGTGSTQPRRATYNVICLVADGEGTSTVGEKTINWSKHDVFTIPHWTWVSHQAKGGDADLFLVTDRSIPELLGFVRIETRD